MGDNTRKWTIEEDRVIQESYRHTVRRDIAVRLGRSVLAVQHRARRLGVNRPGARLWSLDDDSFLRDNYGILTLGEIGRRLRRTPHAVSRRAIILGISEDDSWVSDEDDYMRSVYSSVSFSEVVAHLDRSPAAIRRRAVVLGLTEPRLKYRAPWVDEGVGYIPLHSRQYSGLIARVDADDLPLVLDYRWIPKPARESGRFYAFAMVPESKPRRTVRMHELIIGGHEGEEIDHWDGDGLNNHRSNLRVASRSQNKANMRKRSGTSSVYKGVSFDRRTKRWIAGIVKDGQSYWLGRFSTEQSAAMAYDAKARELFGEFARLNFPDGV